MKKISLILLVLIVGLFILSACGNKNQATGYAGYNPQQQAPAVGGGCGVSSQIPYEETPVNDLQTNDLAV
tara:strand:- start:1017 stop:1226 length:210 start_codon:yes stop_codon:yes gene_type:complete